MPPLSPNDSLGSPPLSALLNRNESAVLKRLRSENLVAQRKKMRAAKTFHDLKVAPNQRLPGGGRKSKYVKIEKELVELIKENRPCPFLNPRIVAGTPAG